MAEVFAFSDGNPILEFAVFVVIFLLATGLFSLPALNHAADKTFTCLAGLMRRRGALITLDLPVELRRIDFFRIIVGALATSRFLDLWTNSLGNATAFQSFLAVVALVCAVGVLIGLFTTVAAFLLMATGNTLIDNFLGSSTLGTMVLSMVLLLFVLAPAGRTLSVDAWLLRRTERTPWLIRSIVGISGIVSADRVLIAKFMALFCYFLICLYSVSWHLHDTAWMSGNVITWLLLSKAANPKYYYLSWQTYEWLPVLFIGLTRFALFGMIVWYVLILPGLFLGKWVRYAIIIWAFAFFLISAHVLPLRYLGWYELCFWGILFLSGPFFGSARVPAISILFDDRCNFCDRTVKFLARIDLFQIAEFRPIRRNIEFADRHGVSLEQGLIDLVGIRGDSMNTLSGYPLYEFLAGRILLLWWIKPLFVVGRLFGIGPALYRWIASRRTRIFGVCESSTIPDIYPAAAVDANHSGPGQSLRKYSGPVAGLIATAFLLGFAFSLRLPIFDTQADSHFPGTWSRAYFGSAPLALGIGKVDVFNNIDLSSMRVILIQRWVETAVNLTDKDVVVGPLQEERPYLDRMSDKEIYTIVAHKRRMSRMNLRCDEAFFAVLVDQLGNLLRGEELGGAQANMAIDVLFERWPTYRELSRFQYRPLERMLVCRALVDLRQKKIRRLIFFQDGVDAILQSGGLQPFIRAEAAHSALRFPCDAEVRYVGKYFDRLAGELAQSDEIERLVTKLSEREFGEFEIECLAKAWKVRKAMNLDWGPTHPPPETDSCDLELAVLESYLDALPLDMKADLKEVQNEALAARQSGEFAQCIVRASQIRRAYWEFVTADVPVNH